MRSIHPIAKDSDLKRGQRVVAEGRNTVRRVLYMAAVATIQPRITSRTRMRAGPLGWDY
jgi:hypothetical protein